MGEDNPQDVPLFSSPEFDKFRESISQADVQLGSMIAQAQQFANLKFFQLPYQFGNIEEGFQIDSALHILSDFFGLIDD